MTKIFNQSASLQDIIDSCDSVVFTESAQTVKSTALLASPRVVQTLIPSDFSAIEDGDTSGKKLIFKAKTGMSIVGDGSLQHANFFSGSVHRITSQLSSAKSVNDGDEWNVNAFDVLELSDPA